MAKPSKLNIIWGSTGSVEDPGDTKFNLGWVSEIPPYQWFNYILNKITAFIAHLNTYGIPEWDSLTEYKLGSKVIHSGVTYRCLVASSTGNTPGAHADWYAPEPDFETRITTVENNSDQALKTTDAVVFASVDTGQGANELYAMDQDVKTTDNVQFGAVSTNTINEKTANNGVVIEGVTLKDSNVTIPDAIGYSRRTGYARFTPTTGAQLFAALATYIPNTGNTIAINGFYAKGATVGNDDPVHAVYATRTSTTTITVGGALFNFSGGSFNFLQSGADAFTSTDTTVLTGAVIIV